MFWGPLRGVNDYIFYFLCLKTPGPVKKESAQFDLLVLRNGPKRALIWVIFATVCKMLIFQHILDVFSALGDRI